MFKKIIAETRQSIKGEARIGTIFPGEKPTDPSQGYAGHRTAKPVPAPPPESMPRPPAAAFKKPGAKTPPPIPPARAKPTV
jgi:hypothetical protein